MTACSHEDASKRSGAAGNASATSAQQAVAAGSVLLSGTSTASAPAAPADGSAPMQPASASGAPKIGPGGTLQSSASGSPQSSASGAPAPAPTGPQIYSIATSPNVVHAGEAVIWDVRTTPNIVTVTAHVSAYTIPLHRTAPGRFALNFTIPPNVPGIFHGVYSLDVTARTETGASASRTVSMSFQ